MGEGEFKKRIREIIRQRQLVDPNYVDTYLRMLDEAAKKFPAKLKTWHVGTVEFYSSKEIDKWLVEWFGDRSTDVRGDTASVSC